MRPAVRLLATLTLGLLLRSAWSIAPDLDEATLGPTPQQLQATRLIVDFISNHHYKKTRLDDTLSAATLDRYLESLDPNRSFFIKDDIVRFSSYANRLDDTMRDGDLTPPFEIFRVFKQRVQERVNYATAALNRKFDFERDEDYQFDRAEADWASDPRELDEIWRKRIKNDVLALRIAGQEQDQIIKTLRERYDRLGRRTDQLTADDVYRIYINAYMASVEPHTAYFSPRDSEDFEIKMSLSLEGIGALLKSEQEHTVIQRVIPGGPASLSNEFNPGDRITGVGQGAEGELVDVVGWRLSDVVDLIRGPKGTVVRLQVLPEDSGPDGARKVITLTRDTIKLEEQAAKKAIIEVPTETAATYRVGVIDVPAFYADFAAYRRGDKDYRSTTRDVERLINELQEDNIDGLIIDLRGNGGGALMEATRLTGLFIRTGPIVQVRDSAGRIEVYEDTDPGVAYSGPLAVLVDRHSASASEIFAGAIQDYFRGIVIGEPTFGKGTVQSIVDLDRFDKQSEGGLGQLKATTAQFFRISGESTQLKGVVPDIVLPTAIEDDDYGERSQDNALPWDRVRPVVFARGGAPTEFFGEAQRRHQTRIETEQAFRYLLEDLEAREQVRNQHRVSLLEKERRKQREAQEKQGKERSEKLRSALGLPADEEKESLGDEIDYQQQVTTDVILREAAHILQDLIQLSQSPTPTPSRTASLAD